MRKKFLIGLIALLTVVGLGLGGYFWVIPKNETSQSAQTTRPQAKEEPAKPKPPFIDLQSILDDWAGEQTGQASAVIYDLDNDQLAGEINPDEVYFAASQYKLFVAYIGYQRIADDTYDFDETYVAGKTRKQCLDEMIRISDNPCSETLWEELGKQEQTQLLKTEYGLENTNMEAIETTAGDVAVILKRLWQEEDLSQEHRELMLESLKGQIHTLALPSAFSDGVTVYTKVGFSQWEDYHDTAIVTFPYDDPKGQIEHRSYVFSILTREVGTANIRDLAQRLEQAIVNN